MSNNNNSVDYLIEIQYIKENATESKITKKNAYDVVFD